ncbi:hypothetical protein Y032_0124g1198 [Ancylostoma ceylanicum]|nr:hypothetical protein Y032_0124g1198 [Ancylostoma ceylanicum]
MKESQTWLTHFSTLLIVLDQNVQIGKKPGRAVFYTLTYRGLTCAGGKSPIIVCVHLGFPIHAMVDIDGVIRINMCTYSQLQMSVDKSWDRGAVFLRVSALHATLNPCSRQRESRAAAPTLVYGHLELTVDRGACVCRIDFPPISGWIQPPW